MKMKHIYCIFLLIIVTSCNILPVGNTIYRPAPTYPQSTPSTTSNERSEFEMLMEKDKINKKRVNAEVLTYLLNDTDPKETHTATVITNNSGCDIILRLVGIRNNQIYNLPIGRNSKNQFVIQKGDYTLKSNVCNAHYYSQKNITDPLILKLGTN